MSLRIEVDRDQCMGTGACAYALPEVFEVGEDGVARVAGDVDKAGEQEVEHTVAECPMAALRLVRTADGAG